MDIQWQLLVTHAVGFLITVWILKKFAWGPLLALMDERRAKIQGEFDKIETEMSRVDTLAVEYDAKLKGIDEERRAKLVDAVIEGKKVAEEIKLAAQDQARKIAEKARGELERDVAKARVALKEDMVSMTISATEKIIMEKLDHDKHRQLIGQVIDGLEKV
ncbi:MAG: F0F1 ATP synthase subunit B [candidate division Zixibacteria bacterium]|nr:F0F1 ATP synthase subunit B [candidate division Zixibacteria bacterium]